MGRGERISLRYRCPRGIAFPCALGKDSCDAWYSPLPVYVLVVSVDGGKNFVSPPKESAHRAEFLAGRAQRVEIFLPGRRSFGMGLEASGIVWDGLRNPTIAAPWCRDVELSVKSGHETVATLGRLGEFMRDESRFVVQLPELRPGVYRVVGVDPEAGKEMVRSNPLEVTAPGETRRSVFWGGIHAHSEMSDGMESQDEVYRRAREDTALDVAACGDHSGHFSENQWRWMQDVTDGWNEEGRFVTLLGYEWNTPNPKKGRSRFDFNIYAAEKYIPRFTGVVPIETGLEVFSRMDNVVVETHHVGPMVLDLWEYAYTRELVRLFEVCSVHGVYRPEFIEGKEGAIGILDKGVRIGLIGGGDSHTGYCTLGPKVPVPDQMRLSGHSINSRMCGANGLLGIVADGLTRREVMGALRARRVYATTGARILLEFEVSGVPMGVEGVAREAVVAATVHACADIDRITVIRDGVRVHEVRQCGLDTHLRWEDRDASVGEHYYFIRIDQVDGEAAWSSPVWLRKNG